MDLTSMSLDELKALEKEVAQMIKSYEARQKAVALADVEERARAHGFTLKQLLGEDVAKKIKTPAPVKYKNPDNPAQGWTGRGRKPNWLVERLAAGAKLEDFAVS